MDEIYLEKHTALFSNMDRFEMVMTKPTSKFDFLIASGEITEFDSTSMRFEAPVDNYSNTTDYDKYLVFPRRNILV
jgi:hypothetical protein